MTDNWFKRIANECGSAAMELGKSAPVDWEFIRERAALIGYERKLTLKEVRSLGSAVDIQIRLRTARVRESR